MNLNKMDGIFNPSVIGDDRIHIIGCGSVGSSLAEILARFGFEKFNLWDFDKVESKNIVNQMYTEEDLKMEKTAALSRILKRINPDIEIRVRPNGYTDETLGGYIFLCPDSMEVRRRVVENHRYSANVKVMFDFRTGLFEGQHYAAEWNNPEAVERLWKSMNFTDEEAKLETPRSACGGILGVAPTVRMITAAGAMNFVNYLRGKPLKRLMVINAENFDITAV